jgi:hypothetical protein
VAPRPGGDFVAPGKNEILNDAFWKIIFTPKVGVLIALNYKTTGPN